MKLLDKIKDLFMDEVIDDDEVELEEEEKAEYKESLVPYFIGAVMLFAICTIVKVLQIIGQSINNI